MRRYLLSEKDTARLSSLVDAIRGVSRTIESAVALRTAETDHRSCAGGSVSVPAPCLKGFWARL